MLLYRADEGALGHRPDDCQYALAFVEEHQRGDVPDFELRHRLGVLVRAEF